VLADDKFNRTMIRAHDLVKDIGTLQMRFKPGVHAEIVDAPAYVLLPGLETVGPPAVSIGILAEFPERVYVSCISEPVHPRTFFGQVSGILLVPLGIREINRLVGNIVIAAEDDVLSF
jgi:hypothetical protein